MKKVSIVSNSLIVVELLKLVFKRRVESICYFKSDEEIDMSGQVFFVDDSLPNFEQIATRLHNDNKTLVVLGEDSGLAFEPLYSIKKPFLPNDIESLVETIEFEDSKDTQENVQTKILDADEIAHIRALMDAEESEEIQEEMGAMELLEQKESLHLKKRQAKEFLYELSELKPREIKKLLKKAKVSLKVTFKKSDFE